MIGTVTPRARRPSMIDVRLGDQAVEQRLGQTLGPALEQLQRPGPRRRPAWPGSRWSTRPAPGSGRPASRRSGRRRSARRCGRWSRLRSCRSPRSRRAGETDQGLRRIERRTNPGQRLPDERQGLARFPGLFGHGLDRRHLAQLRAFAGLEPDLLAQRAQGSAGCRRRRWRRRRETPHRLQRDLGRLFGIEAEADEVRRRGAHRPVLRQIPTRLTHEPDRAGSRGLAGKRGEKLGRLLGGLGGTS
jgi:hypothetical protein